MVDDVRAQAALASRSACNVFSCMPLRLGQIRAQQPAGAVIHN